MRSRQPSTASPTPDWNRSLNCHIAGHVVIDDDNLEVLKISDRYWKRI